MSWEYHDACIFAPVYPSKSHKSFIFVPPETLRYVFQVARFRKAVVSSPTHQGRVISAGVNSGTTKPQCARTHSNNESRSWSSSESKKTPSEECLRWFLVEKWVTSFRKKWTTRVLQSNPKIYINIPSNGEIILTWKTWIWHLQFFFKPSSIQIATFVVFLSKNTSNICTSLFVCT